MKRTPLPPTFTMQNIGQLGFSTGSDHLHWVFKFSEDSRVATPSSEGKKYERGKWPCLTTYGVWEPRVSARTSADEAIATINRQSYFYICWFSSTTHYGNTGLPEPAVLFHQVLAAKPHHFQFRPENSILLKDCCQTVCFYFWKQKLFFKILSVFSPIN